MFLAAKRLIDDVAFAERLAKIEMSLHALEVTERRMLLDSGNEHPPGAEASLLKVRGTEIQSDVFRLSAQASAHFSQIDIGRIGDDRLSEHPYSLTDAARNYFNYRKTPIYSGSNEIQRNIVAKAKLGL